MGVHITMLKNIFLALVIILALEVVLAQELSKSADQDMEKLMSSFEKMESLLENFTKTYLKTLMTLNMEKEKKEDYCNSHLLSGHDYEILLFGNHKETMSWKR